MERFSGSLIRTQVTCLISLCDLCTFNLLHNTKLHTKRAHKGAPQIFIYVLSSLSPAVRKAHIKQCDGCRWESVDSALSLHEEFHEVMMKSVLVHPEPETWNRILFLSYRHTLISDPRETQITITQSTFMDLVDITHLIFPFFNDGAVFRLANMKEKYTLYTQVLILVLGPRRFIF